MKKILLTIILATLSAGCATASENNEYGPAVAHETSTGTVLTTPAGMTLYTYDKDAKGRSSCTGSCAERWPPFAASESDQGTGDFSVIQRSDGSRQWSYYEKPLYRFVGDKAAGDSMGSGVGGVWHTVPAEEGQEESKSSGNSGGYDNDGW